MHIYSFYLGGDDFDENSQQEKTLMMTDGQEAKMVKSAMNSIKYVYHHHHQHHHHHHVTPVSCISLKIGCASGNMLLAIHLLHYRIYSLSSSIQLIRPPIFYRNHNFLNNSFIRPPYVTCNIVVVIVVFWKDPTWFVLQENDRGEMCNLI